MNQVGNPFIFMALIAALLDGASWLPESRERRKGRGLAHKKVLGECAKALLVVALKRAVVGDGVVHKLRGK